MRRLSWALGFLVLWNFGCGSEAVEPEPEPTPSPQEEERVGSDEESSPDTEAAEPPPEPPVNLLRGVSADLAVSSAYRGQRAQVERLVDDNLDTAWNSRSGDLVGTWIDVRLPQEVTVSSVMLTVGFTREGGQTDLFTGNHRVSRIRVSRDGVELGVFPLDTESRALQSVPVEGPGGVYRIEVIETLPGSRSNWREACISELRVMGRAPTVHVGERIPRLAVGELPAPRPQPVPVDRAEIQRLLEQRVRQFIHSWNTMERERADMILNTGDDGTEEAARLTSVRRRALNRVADFVGRADEVAADRVRIAIAQGRDDDLDVPTSAFAAVVDWLDEDDVRCSWAIAHVRIRIGREVGHLRGDINHAELAPMNCDGDACFRDAERSSRMATRRERVLRSAAHDLSNGSTRGVPRARELMGYARAEAIQSTLGQAESLCGWEFPE